jgi:hypothetical protein
LPFSLRISKKFTGNKKWAIAHWFASPNEFFIVADEVEA